MQVSSAAKVSSCKIHRQRNRLLEIDGSLVEKELAPGETLILDTGYLAAMTESVKFEIVSVKGLEMPFSAAKAYSTPK